VRRKDAYLFNGGQALVVVEGGPEERREALGHVHVGAPALAYVGVGVVG
jgi:hypothetical protein